MKMKLSLPYTFILFLTLFSCNHDNPAPQNPCQQIVKVNQAAKDYLYFKKGSWWVYEKEGTGETDSVWVFRDSSWIDPENQVKNDCRCGRGKCAEFLEVDYFDNSHRERSNYYNSNVFLTGVDDDKTEIAEGSHINILGTGYRFSFQPNTDFQDTPTSNGSSVIKLDSFSVNGKYYKEVLHLFYLSRDHYPDWHPEAWYAKGYNLIKFQLNDGSIWDLKNCHVIL